MKQYWPHLPLLAFAVLLAVVGLHLASKSHPQEDPLPGVAQAPPELQGLGEELAKPEYRDLTKEEALQLLESRGFDFNRAEPQEQGS